MILLYFLLPLILIALCEIPTFREKGFVGALKRVSVWIRLFGAEVFTAVLLMILFMDFAAPLGFSPLKVIAAAIVSLLYVVIVYGFIMIKRGVSFKGVLLICALVAILLEGSVFNFRFYQSYEYEKLDLSDRMALSSSFVLKKDNIYTVAGSGTPSIEIKDLDMKIYNIYVDVIARDGSGNVVNAFVDTYITDESNENYFKLPSQTVMSDVESTKYLFVLTNGESDSVKLNFSTNYAKTYEINGIYVNTPQSLHISLLRILGVCAILFLFWLLRPSGRFFSYAFTDSLRQRTVTTAVIVLEVILLLTISFFNPIFSGNPSKHTSQYQKLAESFIAGQLYLEEEPPAFLAEMENPYDKAARDQMVSETGESIHWDAAYFEGKYYVYFGVLPVLMLYLPFRLITGTAMSNLLAIQIYSCFFVVGAFLLIARIIKKYFADRNIPYLSYLIFSLIFVNASGGVFIAKRPDFYSVPILAALSLTVFGLYFWMLAEEKGRVRPFIAALGSLCMALVAACRPQLLLCSALIFVVYWNAVFKDCSLFSKKGWKATLALILPYLLVAAGVMWYNYARFGSPFDFGANYNLTTNDMTGRGYRVERVGLSIFTYFFQLPNITASFPFIQSVSISTNYLGTTITEPMFGGIFIVIPLLWCLCFLPSMWKSLKADGVLGFCTVLLLLSLVIGAFDAQGAGLLQRYVSDFSFLACLSAIFFLCHMYKEESGWQRTGINRYARFALYASGAYCFFMIFAKYSTEIFYRNPYLFNAVSELVQFW